MSASGSPAMTRRPPRDPSKITLELRGFWNVEDQIYGLGEKRDGTVRWLVKARVGHGKDSLVGQLCFTVIDRYEVTDIWFDHDAHLHSIAATIFEYETRWPVEEIMNQFEAALDNVLILEEAYLEPSWRGFGLGPYLAGLAISRLSSGIGFVALEVGSVLLDQTDEEKAAAKPKIQKAWEKIGFTYLKDDIMVADPDLSKETEELGEKIIVEMHR